MIKEKSLSKHLSIRVGIIVVLFVMYLISASLISDSPEHRNGDMYLFAYYYVAVIFPIIVAFWLLILVIETIILAYKKETRLRNANMITLLITTIILTVSISALVNS